MGKDSHSIHHDDSKWILNLVILTLRLTRGRFGLTELDFHVVRSVGSKINLWTHFCALEKGEGTRACLRIIFWSCCWRWYTTPFFHNNEEDRSLDDSYIVRVSCNVITRNCRILYLSSFKCACEASPPWYGKSSAFGKTTKETSCRRRMLSSCGNSRIPHVMVHLWTRLSLYQYSTT